MITADTITDEQIRELHSVLTAEIQGAWGGATVRALTLDDIEACATAITSRRIRLSKRRRARARCAEILNARAKGTK